MKTLGDIIGDDARFEVGSPDQAVSGLALDTRKVAPGELFIAIRGHERDGADFIPAAIAAGASAILCREDATIAPPPAGVAVLRAANEKQALARIAARYFGHQPATVVAVTGTSGKSSVAEFTRQIFSAGRKYAASLGTIGVVKPDGAVYGSLTTPDQITLHWTLADLADEGITHLAFEASSHGLDQFRMDGVAIKAAGFTNLGHDHLDYHPTVEDYFQAKLRLFTERLPDDGTAVVNIDGDFGQRVAAACRERRVRVLTVGRTPGADLRVVASEPDGFAQAVTVGFAGREFQTRLDLIGGYQADNAALAAGLAIAVGEDPETCFAAFNQLIGVKGRLERVGQVKGADVIVDYAHKPEALEAALAALRPFATGRLVCVFGCGGNRDKDKRPVMGAIATRLADVVIVTDDNPRREDPAQIRSEILDAAPGAREIGDRAEAIRTAISEAGPGDVIVIAGKGHETGQEVAGTVHPFSDHDIADAAIGEVQGQ
jgi:UDP-N-acetylmuramoyl-L-alanyl-D-glutamate--2,6-diaminopimelate ligase